MELIEVDALNYRFLIYPKGYHDGIEKEIGQEPKKLDVATLADGSGYYYSTLYGLDNIKIPFLCSYVSILSNFAPLGEIKLTDLVALAESYERKMGLLLKTNNEEIKSIEAIERLRKVEDVIFKALITRAVVKELSTGHYSDPKGLVYFTGVVKYCEEQKLRNLGNGKAIYLSKQMIRGLGICEGERLRLKLVGKRILVEKAEENDCENMKQEVKKSF